MDGIDIFLLIVNVDLHQ